MSQLRAFIALKWKLQLYPSRYETLAKSLSGLSFIIYEIISSLFPSP